MPYEILLQPTTVLALLTYKHKNLSGSYVLTVTELSIVSSPGPSSEWTERTHEG